MCTGAIERETVCETERGVFAGLRVVVGGGSVSRIDSVPVCRRERERERAVYTLQSVRER